MRGSLRTRTECESLPRGACSVHLRGDLGGLLNKLRAALVLVASCLRAGVRLLVVTR